MQVVLDLDLDVFSQDAVSWPRPGTRPSEERHRCASPLDVRRFLEQRCLLTYRTKLPGAEFRDHDEAFSIWKRWIDNGTIVAPFEVVHVDAHADMGMGDSGYLYLMDELLALPLEERGTPRRGHDAMNAGNYLMFAIANRWISRLTYVFPQLTDWIQNWNSAPSGNPSGNREQSGRPTDLMPMHFRNCDIDSGHIELKHCDRATLDRCMGRRTVGPAISLEPGVPFEFTPIPRFGRSGFTHMVVARSPEYTPRSADSLLPILREYYEPT